jgi:hypothetical protein
MARESYNKHGIRNTISLPLVLRRLGPPLFFKVIGHAYVAGMMNVDCLPRDRPLSNKDTVERIR